MRIPFVLYALALVVRVVLIWHFPDPAYPDSFYYVDVARNLAAGHGFNIDLIWIFPEVGGTIPVDPVLPIPSNAHWMPLASLVQVPFIWLLGATPWASALPFALIGSVAAPLTWAMARDARASDRVALGAGILVAVPVLSIVYMVQPDNFSLYQPLVLASLWMGARGLKGSPRSFAAAGLLAGLATLSRNDGLLVLAALGIAFLWDRWRRRAIPWSAAFACVGLFLVVMAPWWLRQLAVFGSLSPSTASGKVFFIRDIGEWNSITTPATLQHLLGMGIGPLVETRIGGLVSAVMIYAVLVGGVVLVPFMVIGGWARRRSLDFGPFFLYAGLLFAFSALVSAVHVPGWDIHPFRGGTRAAFICPRPRGHRRGRRLGRSTAAELGRTDCDAGVHRRCRRLRRRRGDRRIGVRPRRLGRQPRQVPTGRIGPRCRRMHPRRIA